MLVCWCGCSWGFDVRSAGSGAMAHKNVNLLWLKPLMGDLELIELFSCRGISRRAAEGFAIRR